MKITAGQWYDAVCGLKSIMSVERYPLMIPQIAKFRVAKLHDQLERQYVLIEAARAAIIQRLGHEVFTDASKTISGGWSVEPGTAPFGHYVKEWNALREQGLETDAKPMPLAMFGNDPKGIEAGEWKLLGPFVEDNVSDEGV